MLGRHLADERLHIGPVGQGLARIGTACFGGRLAGAASGAGISGNIRWTPIHHGRRASAQQQGKTEQKRALHAQVSSLV
jgi:hypothetical protein